MITRTPFNRFITGPLFGLILFCCLNGGTAWGQSVSQTRLYPADGRQFGGAMASDGTTLLVGDAFWFDYVGQAATGAAYVLSPSGGGLVEQTQLTADDGQAYDLFGASLAVSGAVAAVGAPFHNGAGAVYVFNSTNGVWAEAQEIVPPHGVAGDLFGCSVAINSNTLAVGAYRRGKAAGAVYMYALAGGNWTLQQTLTPPGAARGAEFGFSLALSGQSLLIGAPGANAGSGAAYAYAQIGGQWHLQTSLAPASGSAQFGYAVALEGSQAAIGAPGASNAYVYQQSGSAGWALQASLSPFEGSTVSGFGSAIAMTAGMLVVSAVNTDDGETYVYTDQNSQWTPYAELIPYDGGHNGGFGTAVAVVGSQVAVSRPYAVARPGTSASPVGMVYNFTFGPELKSVGGLYGDSDGYALAASASTLFCGAPGASGSGSVYAYARGATGVMSPPAVLTDAKGRPGDSFGASIAVSGATLAIGAPNAFAGRGAVDVYSHASSGWTLRARLVASDGASGDGFGTAVSLSGSTLVIGAPGGNGGAGAAYVFKSSSGVWRQTQELTTPDGQVGDGLGASIATDGVSIVVGSPNAASPNNSGAGVVYVFALASGQWTLTAELSPLDGAFGDGFGVSVAVAGNQLLVGAPGHLASTGAVYPYIKRSGTFVAQSELLPPERAAIGDQFGAALSLSGQSLVIGAPGHNASAGEAVVYGFQGGMWSAVSALYGADSLPVDSFGAAVAVYSGLIAAGAPDANFGIGSLYTN